MSCRDLTTWQGTGLVAPAIAAGRYARLVKKNPLMMTSSNGNIFRVTGHLCGEFTGPRWIPRTKASDAELWFFLLTDLRLNKRLSKQSWGWWFETLSRPLWRHCNVILSLSTMCPWGPTILTGRRWARSVRWPRPHILRREPTVLVTLETRK